jgi:DNA polymerase III epsilon subunit-like protein
MAWRLPRAVRDADSWLAIDFETASSRATPCAVGLVEVEDGRPQRAHSWLIRPPIFEFWPFNVALHGITPEMCADAADWPTSLREILRIADGRPLVAHNAGFDIGVLRDACTACELPWPSLDYACTLVLARRLWPDLDSHSLPFVVSHLGIELRTHHDPCADALAAAEVGLRALDESGADDFATLAEENHVLLGRIDPEQWTGCHGRDYKAPLPLEARPGVEVDPNHPLYDVSVTFTGALAIPRRQAQQLVVDCGGAVTRGPTQETDVLVTGYQDLTVLAAGSTKSAKLSKAEDLRGTGQPLEIVSERDFVRLVSGEPFADAAGESIFK